jgi:hypothetical protein
MIQIFHSGCVRDFLEFYLCIYIFFHSFKLWVEGGEDFVVTNEDLYRQCTNSLIFCDKKLIAAQRRPSE